MEEEEADESKTKEVRANISNLDKKINSIQSFKCPKCNQTYNIEKLMRDHFFKLHGNESDYEKLCGNKHLPGIKDLPPNVVKVQRFCCSLCSNVHYPTNRLIKAHYMRYHPDISSIDLDSFDLKKKVSMYHCQNCIFKTFNIKEYEKHLTHHIYSKRTKHVYICHVCDSRYESRQDMIKHKKLHDVFCSINEEDKKIIKKSKLLIKTECHAVNSSYNLRSRSYYAKSHENLQTCIVKKETTEDTLETKKSGSQIVQDNNTKNSPHVFQKFSSDLQLLKSGNPSTKKNENSNNSSASSSIKDEDDSTTQNNPQSIIVHSNEIPKKPPYRYITSTESPTEKENSVQSCVPRIFYSNKAPQRLYNTSAISHTMTSNDQSTDLNQTTDFAQPTSLKTLFLNAVPKKSLFYNKSSHTITSNDGSTDTTQLTDNVQPTTSKNFCSNSATKILPSQSKTSASSGKIPSNHSATQNIVQTIPTMLCSYDPNKKSSSYTSKSTKSSTDSSHNRAQSAVPSSSTSSKRSTYSKICAPKNNIRIQDNNSSNSFRTIIPKKTSANSELSSGIKINTPYRISTGNASQQANMIPSDLQSNVSNNLFFYTNQYTPSIVHASPQIQPTTFPMNSPFYNYNNAALQPNDYINSVAQQIDPSSYSIVPFNATFPNNTQMNPNMYNMVQNQSSFAQFQPNNNPNIIVPINAPSNAHINAQSNPCMLNITQNQSTVSQFLLYNKTHVIHAPVHSNVGQPSNSNTYNVAQNVQTIFNPDQYHAMLPQNTSSSSNVGHPTHRNTYNVAQNQITSNPDQPHAMLPQNTSSSSNVGHPTNINTYNVAQNQITSNPDQPHAMLPQNTSSSSNVGQPTHRNTYNVAQNQINTSNSTVSNVLFFLLTPVIDDPTKQNIYAVVQNQTTSNPVHSNAMLPIHSNVTQETNKKIDSIAQNQITSNPVHPNVMLPIITPVISNADQPTNQNTFTVVQNQTTFRPMLRKALLLDPSACADAGQPTNQNAYYVSQNLTTSNPRILTAVLPISTTVHSNVVQETNKKTDNVAQNQTTFNNTIPIDLNVVPLKPYCHTSSYVNNQIVKETAINTNLTLCNDSNAVIKLRTCNYSVTRVEPTLDSSIPTTSSSTSVPINLPTGNTEASSSTQMYAFKDNDVHYTFDPNIPNISTNNMKILIDTKISSSKQMHLSHDNDVQSTVNQNASKGNEVVKELLTLSSYLDQFTKELIKCIKCKQVFDTRDELNSHNDNEHNMRSEQKAEKTNIILSNHINQCTKCGDKFKTSELLMIHWGFCKGTLPTPKTYKRKAAPVKLNDGVKKKCTEN